MRIAVRRQGAVGAVALTVLALLTPVGHAAPTRAREVAAGVPTPPAVHLTAARPVPKARRTVVVVLENKAYSQIIGSPEAPYLNRLARRGALFTRSYALTHPSQPNYLLLFAGSQLGVTDSSCPHTFDEPELGSQLRATGRTFIAYSDGLPSVGFAGCRSGAYVRRHAPWTNFPALPAETHQPFSVFPARPRDLPDLSFVVPDLDNGMHDASIRRGDRWLRANLDEYARWARRHDSLLWVTFDENDGRPGNRITTILVGEQVVPGRYRVRLDHCRVLRTIEASYALAPLGCAADTPPVLSVWRR